MSCQPSAISHQPSAGFLRLTACAFLFLAGCFPPVQERQLGTLIHDLALVHQWDIQQGANQSTAWLQLMGYGPEALPALADAILDERPTMIMDMHPVMIPNVGDVAFLTALRITGERVEDYAETGVRLLSDPNPIFALHFPSGARAKAREFLLQWIEEGKE